ncbi:MAG: hypothetical protein MUC49_11350 [Raineya sp.]|jgi:hypothetical protein|nr:hypothetical protein [Raineya sp.]
MEGYFSSFEEFAAFAQEKQEGHMVIGYFHLPDYAGMVLYLGIHYDIAQNKFVLDLEWMSLGLDFYGDTLQETYRYQFDNLKDMFDYMEHKHQVKVTDIAKKYEFDYKQYPNPLTHEDQKEVFQEAWERFSNNFKSGMFLDTTQKLIYSSYPRTEE